MAPQARAPVLCLRATLQYFAHRETAEAGLCSVAYRSDELVRNQRNITWELGGVRRKKDFLFA